MAELVIEIDVPMQHEEHSEENVLHNIQKVVTTSNTARKLVLLFRSSNNREAVDQEVRLSNLHHGT